MTTAPPPRPPRPREVTFGGVQAVVGGALALVLLIEAAQQLYSTEMEDVLRQALASPRAAGLDMTIDTARTMAKVAIMVMAVMAVMSAVLGIYVLKRHRPSRIALTVLGLVVAVTTLFAGPSGWAVTLYIGGSLALLWTKASRTWFSDPPAPHPRGDRRRAGRLRRLRRVRRRAEPDRISLLPASRQRDAEPRRPPCHRTPSPASTASRRSAPLYSSHQTDGRGSSQEDPMSLPQFPGDSREPDPGLHFPPIPDDYRRTLVRPPTVFAGCVMAWIASALGLVIGIVLITIRPDSQALQNVAANDRADVAHVLGVVGVVLAVWCPIVMVVTYFAFKGHRWAALAMVVMAGVYLLVVLLSLVAGGGGQGGPGLIWSIVSAGLVYVPASARTWYEAKASERERTTVIS